MLIRGFKIDDSNPAKYDHRSTYFYEALLNCPVGNFGFSIEWIKEKKELNYTHPNLKDNILTSIL